MKYQGKGGANTKTGLVYEDKVDLKTILKEEPGYYISKSPSLAGHNVYFDNTLIARCFKKHELYKFLKENNIDWERIISGKLLPDDALLVLNSNTLFIIEVKYQQASGSTGEKLQTCDFKRKQYMKLTQPLKLNVKYYYVLNNWFKKRTYKDVLKYINEVECSYFFNELPLSHLGLPSGQPKQDQDNETLKSSDNE